MEVTNLTILGRANQSLAPVSGTHLVNLSYLQSALALYAPVNALTVAARVTDFAPAVLAVLAANGVPLSGTGSVALLTNGGLKLTGGLLGVDSGVVSLQGHHHLAAQVDDFAPAVLSVLAANGVPVSGTGSVALVPGGGLRSGNGGLLVDSGVVSFIGHQHRCVDIVDLPAGVATLLAGSFTASSTVTPSGTGPLAFTVNVAPAGGLKVVTGGVAVDLGTGHNQAAYGDHTHAQLHNPLTLGGMSSLSGTLTGQQLSLELLPVAGGGLLVTPSGVQVDFSVVGRAGGTTGGLALSVANTPTLQLALSGNVLSGTIPLDANPPGGTGGQIIAGSNGLRVLLGTTSTSAAAGNHTHAVATGVTDGFLSAALYNSIQSLLAAAPPSGINPVSTNTLTLTEDSSGNLSGVVTYNPNPAAGYGALGSNSTGLFVVLGTASNNAAAGNHLHDTRYLQLTGGTLTGPLVLSGVPTLTNQAVTKAYADQMLPLTGGTMTGGLTLAADPSSNLQAATKQYVDNQAALYLPLTGGTLTGALVLSGVPTLTNQAATKGYVDTNFLPLAGGTLTGALVLAGVPTLTNGAATKGYVDTAVAGASAAALPLAGGTMTGGLTLAADPTNNLHAATKQYVDTAALPVAGGSLTGYLTLVADPTNSLHAASKQYVDAAVHTALAARIAIADAATASSDPPTAAEFNALVGTVNDLLSLLRALGLPT